MIKTSPIGCKVLFAQFIILKGALRYYFIYVMDSSSRMIIAAIRIKEERNMRLGKLNAKTIGFYIYSFVLSIPFYIFRMFIIKNNRIFVYGFLNQGVGDHPKYIIKELEKIDNDFQIYWASNKTDKKIGTNIHYVKPKSIRAAYYQATSKFWISTVRLPFYIKKRKGQIYFQTWHGAINLKKIEGECLNALTDRYIITAKHDSQMIDYLVAANRDKVDLFSKYFWFKDGEMLKIGSPRNDIFFSLDDTLRHKLCNQFDCVGKKVLLYAPTFRANGSLDVYDIDYEKLIDAVTKRFGGEWILYIRLHPTLANQNEKLLSSSDLIRNGSLVDDIQELLFVTDVLITDYSSIVFDFMDSKRPAFLYAPDIEEYTKERDFHLNPYQMPFPIARNNSELESNILCFDYEEYQKKIGAFADRIGVFDDGNASKKIANIIVSKKKNTDSKIK